MKREIFSGWDLVLADRHLRSLKFQRDARKSTSCAVKTKRRRLSLWLSFDGMQVFPFWWSYQRVLQEEAGNPKIGISYPDGFVSKDGKWLHLVYDDSRDKLIYYRARLPELPAPSAGDEAKPPEQKS